jgi:glycosyltransferase involved in cell wall biosynthesis
MKILLLGRYGRMGASSRIRFYQYLPALRESGCQIDVAPLLDDAYLADLYAGRNKKKSSIVHRYFDRLLTVMKCRRYDGLWIENELFPWLPSWVEQMLCAAGVKYIVDYEDAVFHRYDRLENTPAKILLGQKIDRIMQGAALVIAGNEYLAHRAVTAGAKQVECLPTVIDLDRYTPTPRTSNDVFTIGWIGSPVTAPYVRHVQPALAALCADTDARLVTVGAGPLKLEAVPVTDHPWSEATEAARISGFDAGIMPLPDTPWTRGKCGYKLIQYMACAKPVVASAVGANLDIVDPGKTGFLVESEKEWITALTRLAEDTALREKMGRQGRIKVAAEYCLQVTASRLIRLIKTCL